MYKKHSHSHSSRKTLLLIATGVLLVLLIAGGTIVYLNRDALFSSSRDDVANTQSSAEIETTIKAEEAARYGRTDEATQILDDSIKNTDSNENKALYYSKKATLALPDDVASAVKFSRQAAELHPTAANLTFAGSLAETSGDKAAAITYYEKALDEVKNETAETADPAGYSAGYYEHKLQTLRAA